MIETSISLSVNRSVSSVLGNKRSKEEITGVPAKVSTVSPINLSANRQLDTTLSWSRPSMAQSYDVWIGTTAGTMVKVRSNQAAQTYPPTLALDSTYYWRVDSKNTFGTTTGDVNSFSTWASDDIWTDEATGVPWTDQDGIYIPHERT